MNQMNKKPTIGIIVFFLGVLLSALAIITQDIKFFTWAVFVISLIYLSMGWHIFKRYYPEGHPLLLFFMGYLYSGVFIATVFYITNWPLAKTIISMTPIWIAIQLVIVFSIKKQIQKNVLIQLIIEAIILLILTIILLMRVL